MIHTITLSCCVTVLNKHPLRNDDDDDDDALCTSHIYVKPSANIKTRMMTDLESYYIIRPVRLTLILV